MAVLDDRISQVHAELVDLARKRRLMKMKINHRHEPFIHRLPLEISSNIFTAYVDDIDSAFDVYNAEGLENWSPALHLSSICVRWRSVARCTAQIWRVIRVPLLRNPINVELLNELMAELFNLSGQHMLSLGLFQYYDDYEDDYLFHDHIGRLLPLGDLLSITRAVTSRCNEISFRGLPLEQVHDLFWSAHTPNLKKFRILEPYGQFEGCHDRFLADDISLLLCPQLEEIEITSATRLLLNLEINWDNITTAKMEGISSINAFEILLRAPRLKTYKISCQEFQPPEDGSLWLVLPLDLPLTHTTLESLEFCSHRHDMGQFFQGVNFPSLKKFELLAPRFGDIFPVKHLISFFQRSPCPLTSFSLSLYSDAIDDDILTLLNALPTLTHLSLMTTEPKSTFTGMSDRFFQELAQRSSGFPKMVTPRLEAFSYAGPLNFTWPAFLKIFDPPRPRTFIPGGDSPIEHVRPLRISLWLSTQEILTVDDDVLAKLQGIQATVNLKIVGLFAGQLTPIV